MSFIKIQTLALPADVIEAFRKFEAAPYPSAQRDELKEDLIELIDNLIEAQENKTDE